MQCNARHTFEALLCYTFDCTFESTFSILVAFSVSIKQDLTCLLVSIKALNQPLNFVYTYFDLLLIMKDLDDGDKDREE